MRAAREMAIAATAATLLACSPATGQRAPVRPDEATATRSAPTSTPVRLPLDRLTAAGPAAVASRDFDVRPSESTGLTVLVFALDGCEPCMTMIETVAEIAKGRAERPIDVMVLDGVDDPANAPALAHALEARGFPGLVLEDRDGRFATAAHADHVPTVAVVRPDRSAVRMPDGDGWRRELERTIDLPITQLRIVKRLQVPGTYFIEGQVLDDEHVNEVAAKLSAHRECHFLTIQGPVTLPASTVLTVRAVKVRTYKSGVTDVELAIASNGIQTLICNGVHFTGTVESLAATLGEIVGPTVQIDVAM